MKTECVKNRWGYGQMQAVPSGPTAKQEMINNFATRRQLEIPWVLVKCVWRRPDAAFQWTWSIQLEE